MRLTAEERQGLQDHVRNLRTEPVGEVEASEHFYEHETFEHARVSYIQHLRTKTWGYIVRYGADSRGMTGYVGKLAARQGAYARMLVLANLTKEND
jgi:hypothetical protein